VNDRLLSDLNGVLIAIIEEVRVDAAPVSGSYYPEFDFIKPLRYRCPISTKGAQ
jgi:hypothetical protein